MRNMTTFGSIVTSVASFLMGIGVGFLIWKPMMPLIQRVEVPTVITVPGQAPDPLTVEVPVKSPIGIGTRIKITASNLRVRNEKGKVLCSQARGAGGIVVEGSVHKNDNLWWRVKFDIGCSGWATQSYLKFQ